MLLEICENEGNHLFLVKEKLVQTFRPPVTLDLIYVNSFVPRVKSNPQCPSLPWPLTLSPSEDGWGLGNWWVGKAVLHPLRKCFYQEPHGWGFRVSLGLEEDPLELPVVSVRVAYWKCSLSCLFLLPPFFFLNPRVAKQTTTWVEIIKRLNLNEVCVPL